MNFKLGQPFRPFEQLMGVLPDRSKKIVPTVYHELMTDPKSPIIDFYPRDFKLDMNGKRMEWEAVVKIPFIEEKRLLSAMAPKNELLSPEEKARNDFGVSLKFTYDPNVNFTYPSSLVGIFHDIPYCHCIENIFDLPTTDGLELYVGLVDGVKLGVDALAGFPSLATLPYNATLGFHGVNVFQQESRNESMVVTLSDVEIRSRVESAKVKLGQKCFVGYPFLQEAKIVRVSDELFNYTLAYDGSGQVVQTHHSGKEIDDWSKKASRIENFYSKRLGIITGPVESMVHVEMLKGLIKTDEGAFIKQYGLIPGMETDYAAQAVVDEVVSEDERFIERAAIPLEEEFPVGSRAFFLGDYAYGRPIQVEGHRNNRADGRVSVQQVKEPEFAKAIIAHAERQNSYKPSYAVARELGLHPLILSKITSSFYVNTIGKNIRVNLGLNLKFEARKQKVLGYSRKSNTGWEFSPTAVKLIVDYIQKFPDFFAALMRNPQGKEVDETDLWPDQDVATAKIKEIGAWLKTVETSKFERVPLEAEQLDSDVVMELQKAADAIKEANSKTFPKMLKGVPRSALLQPKDAEQRLGGQNFRLGDRLIYVQDAGKVPLASKGTVVGISEIGSHHMLDVLCDDAFMNGTTLGGRCDPFRGQTVPANAVLNLTNKQIIAFSKTSWEKRPVSTQVTPLQPAGHGGYGDYGTGRGQLHDAVAPGPLRGSFRGAVNGFNPQVNGRGGQPNVAGVPHLQHSSLVYRPAPNGYPNQPYNQQYHQQANGGSGRSRGSPRGDRGGRGGYRGGARGGSGANSNGLTGPDNGQGQGQGQVQGQGQSFPRQSYNAVPPPAGLDGRGGSRGRGRGRGRGGQGRGSRGAPTAE